MTEGYGASGISTANPAKHQCDQHFAWRYRRRDPRRVGWLCHHRANKSGKGQVVDVALYESIFNLLEGIVPEFDGAGVVREPSGTTITGIVPTNTYLCSDGKHVVICGNGDSNFNRLMT